MSSNADTSCLQQDKPVLDKLGIRTARLIGQGAEALVYDIGNHQVLRLLKPGATLAPLQGQVALLDEIRAGLHSLPFETPQVFSIVDIDGRYATIEKRLPGQTLTTVLNAATGSRAALIRNWLDTAMAISQIHMTRPGYGDLYKPDDCHHHSFHAYWIERLNESLASQMGEFQQVDVAAIVHGLPEPESPALVHLDLFADNLLCQGEMVTAVLDFGYCSIMGDSRLNALCAAVYAGAEFIPAQNGQNGSNSPNGHSDHSDQSSDQDVIDQWLEQHELLAYYDTVQRMLACYWAFADDDEQLAAWCRRIL